MSGHNTLGAIKRQITEKWDSVDQYQHACREARLEVGHLLIKAKALVKHGEWEDWFADAFPNRTLRDGQRCMKMAGADDPEAALEAERKTTADRVQGIRDQAKSDVRTSYLPGIATAKAAPDPAVWAAQLPAATTTPVDTAPVDTAPAPVNIRLTVEQVIAWYRDAPGKERGELLAAIVECEQIAMDNARDQPQVMSINDVEEVEPRQFLARITYSTPEPVQVTIKTPPPEPQQVAPVEPPVRVAPPVPEPDDDGGLFAALETLKLQPRKSAIYELKHGELNWNYIHPAIEERLEQDFRPINRQANDAQRTVCLAKVEATTLS
jgi:hypothetical protein